MGRGLRWGEIEYLNLLPVRVFLKKKGVYGRWSVKKGVPSQINRWLRMGKVECGFISSVEARGRWCLPVGIAAVREVWSVLLCPGRGRDSASATSNLLAEVVGERGEVVIGDRALQLWAEENGGRCRDLAQLWWEQTQLPFVFALLCCRNRKICKKIAPLFAPFLTTPPPIPRYILLQWANRLKLPPSLLLSYLQLIHYRIGWRERRGLNRFLKRLRPYLPPRFLPLQKRGD
jgi:chorismate dehydratase